MGRTIADALREEGVKKGRKEGRKEGEVKARRETLLRQLRKRFRAVPPDTLERIEATEDIKQLDAWLDRVVTASTLEQMRIAPPKEPE